MPAQTPAASNFYSPPWGNSYYQSSMSMGYQSVQPLRSYSQMPSYPAPQYQTPIANNPYQPRSFEMPLPQQRPSQYIYQSNGATYTVDYNTPGVKDPLTPDPPYM